MGKFLLGLFTGAVLVVLVVVLGVFAVASLKSKPPSVEDGSTLILRLSGDVPEKPSVDLAIPLLADRTALTVENIWSILRRAAKDSRIRAVVFEPDGAGVGWAKMQEIRSDIEAFRKSGKPIYAYLKTPSTRDYYMASACTKIYMLPSDVLNVKGIALELMYFKGTLDKLGVQVDVEHAGKYKDYGDMFTKTSMSPETKEVLDTVADEIYSDLIGAIAKGRGKDAAAVRKLLDDGPFLAGQAKANGLVDELRYEDEMFGELKTALKQTELKKLAERDYVASPDSTVVTQDKVAWVVGEGSITRGDADSSGDGGIESAAFVKMLSKVANDSSVKGVVVRIDSPGGEVMASDELWRAMNELRKRKAVVISMSDAAASGGYYMAMTGDTIVAYPGTETGSIGVVFAKPNLRGLYDKVGISKSLISRGRFATIESEYEPMTEAGRMKLRDGIDSEYQDFLSKVATARKKKVSEIEPVAQGRVWLGDQAKANGLVDELGGIDRALELVKKKAGIPATSNVNLVLYPGKRSVFDVLFRQSGDSAEAEAKAAQAKAVEVMLGRVGLESFRAAWHDDRMRVFLRGGMLRMMPFTMEFR